jgi:ABC-type transport system involved in multi-copper enzyme maturation permease subunit
MFPPGSNDTVTGPWTGFAVLCGYTTAALAAAFWLLRRRDV